jgi:hypothetical protein
MLACMAPAETSPQRFVGEPLKPVPGTFHAGMMARGTPGLPRQFAWRGRSYEVEAILEVRRTLGPCTHGSGEKYVRRHWFTIRTRRGAVMTLYCDRQARRGQSPKARWWLFSMERDEDPAAGKATAP